MLLFLSIVEFAVVAFLIVTIERMFSRTAEPDDAERRLFSDGGEWAPALAIGAIVGAINYVTPKLGNNFAGVAIVLMIIMLALSAGLMYWFHLGGSNAKEVIAMSLLALLFYWTTKSTAAMAVTVCKAKFWRLFINVLPEVVFSGSVGFFIVDALFFNYKKSDKKKTSLRVIAWILMVCVTLSVIGLLAPCFFNSGLGLDGTSEISQATTTEVGGIAGWFKKYFTGEGSCAPKETAEKTVKEPVRLKKRDWYAFYNLAMQNDDDPSNDYNFGWNCYNESWTAEDYDKEFRNRIRIDPALGAADMAWLDAKVGTRYIGVFYDECNGAWDKAINAAKEGFMAKNPDELYYPTIEGFFAYLDSAAKVEVRKYSDIKNQMYMNPFTPSGVPDVITMNTSDHKGWFLVYTFKIKNRKVEVAYRIECGFQPCNVTKVMKIDPSPHPTVTPKPTATPKPTPTNTPAPTATPKPTPTPTNTPAPTPTNTPTPTKDPTVGTSPDPGDDPGPGEPTSVGVGGGQSSAEEPGSSDTMTQGEYHEAMDELGQESGGDPSTPTTTSPPGGTTHDSSEDGTGHGGVDDPTSTHGSSYRPPDGGGPQPISSDPPAGEWGGPPD